MEGGIEQAREGTELRRLEELTELGEQGEALRDMLEAHRQQHQAVQDLKQTYYVRRDNAAAATLALPVPEEEEVLPGEGEEGRRESKEAGGAGPVEEGKEHRPGSNREEEAERPAEVKQSQLGVNGGGDTTVDINKEPSPPPGKANEGPGGGVRKGARRVRPPGIVTVTIPELAVTSTAALSH